MKLLLINQDWFAEEWRAAGHEVLIARTAPPCDVRIPAPFTPWQQLCGDFKPDCIVVHDNSSPIIVSGIEEAQVPVVFYSVDAHHHTHYHKLLAGAFDLTFVAQKDYIAEFSQQGNPISWLPLWASRFVEASTEKKYGAVFVGTMDARLNPDRVNFFTELQKRVPLVVERGEYWTIFPHAEIVVNQTVKGDLNFRVFEAMMCGAMLLTEASRNGLEELFTPGRHLVTYAKGDVAQAAQQIEKYLADNQACRNIAAAGREEILQEHLAKHRAATALSAIENLKRRESRTRYFGMMVNYAVLGLLFDDSNEPAALAGRLHALRCAEKAIARHEDLPQEMACHLVVAAAKHDAATKSRAGVHLLRECVQKYPQHPIPAFGAIRDHLNHGEKEAAAEIAGLFPGDKENVFNSAEKLVSELLNRA